MAMAIGYAGVCYKSVAEERHKALFPTPKSQLWYVTGSRYLRIADVCNKGNKTGLYYQTRLRLRRRFRTDTTRYVASERAKRWRPAAGFTRRTV